MGPRLKVFIALTAIGAAWLFVLFELGLWDATLKSSGGVLSYTFNGWADYPKTHHLFLAQYAPGDFAQGKLYTSYTYPFLFFLFLLLAPFHFLLKLPYEVAHNFVPYFQAICLTLLLVLTRKNQLSAILATRNALLWVLVFISMGILVTNPLLWISSLVYNQDNLHILAAGAFCYLSSRVFHDEVPGKAFLPVGVFLALWSPIYIPAWILSGLFFNRALVVERKWMLYLVGVSALAWLNIKLPAYVCSWAGAYCPSSGFLYRSGLDGSTQHMSSIYQAVFYPQGPRSWPTVFYFIITLFFGVGLSRLFQKRKQYHPLRQAFFLMIPYSTIVILVPQLASTHPFFADLLILVPSTFVIAFWFLQNEFWESLTGRTYVAWILLAGLIVMTNLLTVAQNLT